MPVRVCIVAVCNIPVCACSPSQLMSSTPLFRGLSEDQVRGLCGCHGELMWTCACNSDLTTVCVQLSILESAMRLVHVPADQLLSVKGKERAAHGMWEHGHVIPVCARLVKSLLSSRRVAVCTIQSWC